VDSRYSVEKVKGQGNHSRQKP